MMIRDIDSMDNNLYAQLLYHKPKNIFKRIVYYITEIRPEYKKLKNSEASFFTMCQFSDFIKILEMVFFYHNDIKYIPEIDEPIRIISDNSIKDTTKKNLTIVDEKNKVVITFDMRSMILDDYNSDDYINIKCNNGFGKKMVTEFHICNKKVTNDSINYNTYNLLYNINHLLSKLMADLFMKYYKII